MTAKLLAFKFFERGQKNIKFHLSYCSVPFSLFYIKQIDLVVILHLLLFALITV